MFPISSASLTTPAGAAANARLDAARAELDRLAQNPMPETAADRLAAQQNDPLRAYPALAAAIAAYHVNDTGANAHTVQAAVDAIPPVPAVAATARTRRGPISV